MQTEYVQMVKIKQTVAKWDRGKMSHPDALMRVKIIANTTPANCELPKDDKYGKIKKAELAIRKIINELQDEVDIFIEDMCFLNDPHSSKVCAFEFEFAEPVEEQLMRNKDGELICVDASQMLPEAIIKQGQEVLKHINKRKITGYEDTDSILMREQK